MGTKLPRKLQVNLQITGEQIRLARLRRDLSISQNSLPLTIPMMWDLLISSNSNESNPDILLDASEEYLIDRKRADQILHQVRGSLNNWEKVAKRLQIHEQELSIFRFRFNKHL